MSEKTYYYWGRVKSEDNKVAVLSTIKYHGTECVDMDGFTYHLTNEDHANRCWKVFDFEKEVGKVMSKDEAEELADFVDLADIKR
ncbi:MAG: hypothetical protein LBP76_04010 [Treponema sp.]|jgi:hypothetical protein|nr:hypothetical protein [Treponema sp.]